MLIFDFDGVLIDSVKEVAVIAYNYAVGTTINSLSDLPDGYLELFELNRPRAKGADDMPALGRWCLNALETGNKRLLSAEEFLEVANSETSSPQERRNKFFKTRKELIDLDFEAWIKLSPPYLPLWNSIKKINLEDFVILTHKNTNATIKICHANNVKISRDNIFSGETGISKTEHMNSIFKKFAVNNLTFIDDSLRNLFELKENFSSIKLELLFPTWGYAAPEDEERAKEAGIKTIDQENFISSFFD